MESPFPIEPEVLLAQTGWVRALARRLVQDEAQAEDVVQETLLAALKSPPEDATTEPQLRAWLRRVVRNLAALSGRRARRRRKREREGKPGISPISGAEAVERAAQHQRIVRVVMELTEPYRSALLLRYFHDLSYEEVAACTGVSVGAARTRVSRGLARLRATLDEEEQGERERWVSTFGMLFEGGSIPLPREASPFVPRLALTTCLGLMAIAVFSSGFGRTPVPRFSFAPFQGPDVSVDRICESFFQMTQEDWKLRVDGGPSDWRPRGSADVTIHRRVMTRDEPQSFMGRRCTSWLREYPQAAVETSLSWLPHDLEDTVTLPPELVKKTGDLEGESVLFRWNPGPSTYEISDVEGGVSPLSRDRVRVDMDLRSLLPPGRVVAGDEWSVPVSSLEDVFFPGGELDWRLGRDDRGAGTTRPFFLGWFQIESVLGDLTEASGSCRLRCGGLRSLSGEECVAIQVMGKLVRRLVLRDSVSVREESKALGTFEGLEALDFAALTLELEVKGVCYWSPSQGICRELSLTGPCRLTVETRRTANGEGAGKEFAQTVVFGGFFSVRAEASYGKGRPAFWAWRSDR